MPRSPILNVSVVISAYTEERWAALQVAVASVAAQGHPSLETIIVVDHNPSLLERAMRELPDAIVVPNTHPRGLSGARNSGIAAAHGDVVAFMDDDARAADGWLSLLLAPYEDPVVVAVGGRIDADWRVPRPSWFPAEFEWVVGCTYLGMPTAQSAVRNLIGANMSFRREVFERVGGFPDGIGRVGTLPEGCEETELCIRVGQKIPGCVILYEPEAAVSHMVTDTRARARYFFARCLAEGRSKAAVAAIAGADDALRTERRYVARVLPSGVARELHDAARGDRSGVARAAMIVLGAVVTAVGYASGSITVRRGTASGA